jgi:hypothetical protein
MNIFDLQFWVICILFGAAIIFGCKWLKNVLINTVSAAVAQVVSDQWALMFKHLDTYKETVKGHDISIFDLKQKCGELEKKFTLNRKDIDDILEKVMNLK